VVQDMPAKDLAQSRNGMGMDFWDVRELPAVLKPGAAEITALGAAAEAGRDAVGVRVQRPGRRPVSLYFDRDTHLLLKSETQGPDPLGGGGAEVTLKHIFYDYREVDGLQFPMRVFGLSRNQRYLDEVFSSVRPLERLDDSLFNRP